MVRSGNLPERTFCIYIPRFLNKYAEIGRNIEKNSLTLYKIQ